MQELKSSYKSQVRSDKNKGLVYVFTGDGKGPPTQRCFALSAYSAVLQAGCFGGYGEISWEALECLKA